MSLRNTPLRQADKNVTQEDMDIAYAGQVILEEIVLGLARRTKALTRSEFLCMAGGVALNATTNGKIMRSGIFKDIFIFPAAGDDGQAIGKLFHDIRVSDLDVDTKTTTAYYGPVYPHEQVIDAIEKHKDKVKTMDIPDEGLLDEVTNRLINGQAVGWFQGGSELGPRALGHRSILADPRREGMKQHINSRVKHREWYRPLAPVVTEEDASTYFNLDSPSPFMLITTEVKEEKRAVIPAVTHIDGTARVQTITKEQDEKFFDLIKHFGKKTGVPVLLNTSFNQKGKPIVETPEDALKTFIDMSLDALVIGDLVLVKTF